MTPAFLSPRLRNVLLATGVAALAIPAASASAAVVSDTSVGTGNPPATLGGYPLTAVASNPDNDLQTVSSDPVSSGGALTFSPALTQFEAGLTWADWGQGYTGDVFANLDGTSSTVTLPGDTHAFYLYAEPNNAGDFTITATSDSGATATQSINGDAAEYFGFYGTGNSTIKTITVSNPDGQADGYAIGEFGIYEAPHITITVNATGSTQTIDAAYLENTLHVPASEAPVVLNDLAYLLLQVPSNSAVTISVTPGLGSSLEAPAELAAATKAFSALSAR